MRQQVSIEIRWPAEPAGIVGTWQEPCDSVRASVIQRAPYASISKAGALWVIVTLLHLQQNQAIANPLAAAKDAYVQTIQSKPIANKVMANLQDFPAQNRLNEVETAA